MQRNHTRKYTTGTPRRLFLRFLSCRYIVTLAVIFHLLLAGSSALAVENSHVAVESSRESAEYLKMPWEYGEVIYRINPASSKQLYIIGISHRNASTGANGSTTVAAQKEIYRIGEWLKNSAQSDLLLPEGYFNDTDCTGELNRQMIDTGLPGRQSVDNAQLEQELAAESFTNAEMLLMQHLSFRACQVENKNIYSAVRSSLDRLNSTADRRSELQRTVNEIRHLQEVRTAQLLQDIPGIIEDQFDYGVIGKRSAIFTIGLNHIKHIFRYIENGSIDLSRSQPEKGSALQQSTLNLLKAGYGISIILPRSLADNLQLLEKTKIDRILLANGNI